MKIAFMPGDGIGPEISAATRLVLEAVDKKYGFGFTYSEIDIGFTALGDLRIDPA
jgi:isocitrate/isopropylmalate dehydrogenase